MLYPIQFTPRVKKTVWGTETALVSGLAGDETVVRNGFLKGNTPGELTEIYMGELLGDEAYLRFGDEFPLLAKLLQTTDRLSVQVHPDDPLAARRHNAYGKDEMWYIVAARPGAEIALGFREGVTREIYERALDAGWMDELLNRVVVEAGDAFFVPAGTVHSVGAGVSLVEIQQPSDVTYRISDFDRGRELHRELAADAITFDDRARVIHQKAPRNEAALLVESGRFTVNLLNVAGTVERELSSREGFTLYICVAGAVECAGVALRPGDAVLIPADQNAAAFSGDGAVLESYL